MDQKKIDKYLFLLILFSSLIRIGLSFSFELGNDEVYYWTYSQNLQWNYFDHPPMIALLIRFFTLNLRFQGFEAFLRLGSIVCSGFSTYFIYRLTSQIHNARSGFLAALLYTASLYGSIIAGLMIMPDSPQMVFWTLSLWCMVGILEKEESWISWLGLGLFSGLCTMSKVHGIFLWIGLGIFLLIKRRKVLASWKPYIAFLLFLILVSPILFWNIQNDFITYRFHSARVGIEGVYLSPLNFLREVLGQIAYNNPLVVGSSLLALLHFNGIKKKTRLSDSLVLLNFIALPMILMVLGIAFYRVTLPHWAGPGYISLIPLTAIYFDENFTRHFIPRAVYWAMGLLPAFLIPALLFIHFFPGTLNPSRNRSEVFGDSLGLDDVTLDLSGWKDTGKVFKEFMIERMKIDHLHASPPLIIDNWMPGSHLDYYFAFPLGMPVIGMGHEMSLHQFVWSNSYELRKSKDFHIAYAVILSNMPVNPKVYYFPYYDTLQQVGIIKAFRGSIFTGYKPTRNFYIYRLSGFKGYIPHIEGGKLKGIPQGRP
jgi:4-amino-4-deoxy-L-arabinose transferase-like glycosyltransferase